MLARARNSLVGGSGCCWLRGDYQRWDGTLDLFEASMNARNTYFEAEICSRLWRCYSKWRFCDPVVEIVSQHFLKAQYPYLTLRSGYKVITTCSPKNFKLVESYGAEKAFDYHSPTCGEDMRAYTNNTLE
jgi:hypothetical protein